MNSGEVFFRPRALGSLPWVDPERYAAERLSVLEEYIQPVARGEPHERELRYGRASRMTWTRTR